MTIEPKLRQFFVCNNCRTNCPSGTECSEELLTDGNPLFPRKQYIECLGEWCDSPCALRKENSDIKISQLIILVKYLGTQLNNQLMKKM